MRILLTGSNGLLGQKIISKLLQHEEVELLATSRGPNRHPIQEAYAYRPLDLCLPQEVEKVFEEFQPEGVIHTAAMTQVDACEEDRKNCDAINVDAVRILATQCQAHGSHLVHISTDFIFDGSSGPYREEDLPNPLNYYGQSKLKAEEEIQSRKLSAAILRTILLYGITPTMSRSNIILWVKKSLEAGKAIRVVNDQERSPTLAEDLADASIAAALKRAEGVYHISGPETLRVVDIAYAVADFWKLDRGLISEIDSASLGQKAKRPSITGFVIEKASKELDYRPHNLKEGLQVLDAQLKAL